MRILIYSEGRVGSHSLGKWLSRELNLPFVAESMEFDYTTNDNFIQKIYFNPKHNSEINQQWLLEKDEIKFEFFDKIIRLYRKNTLEQSVSYQYTVLNKKFQHSDGKFDAYYELTKEFCDEHFMEIYRTMKFSDKSNQELKNIDLGLLVSYEELFIENTGQKLIEDYIGFSSKEGIFDQRHKLRVKNEEMDLYLQELIENYKNGIKLI